MNATAAPRDFLIRLFRAAIARADPASCLPPSLPNPPAGRTIVVGAGKAAAAMARAVDLNWAAPLSGLVVTRYGHALPCPRIRVIEAGHPAPDAEGVAAAKQIIQIVTGLAPEDLVICLISGGGSSLLALPATGIALADKVALTRDLLRSGARIDEINAVRKHLSQIKGGRLAAQAFPAEILTLAISDVPGDDPATIASGPTVADPTSFADARSVLARYGLAPPAAIAAHLEAARDETPKPGDPRLARSRVTLIARPADCLEAAAALARSAGFHPIILGDAIEGESRDVARSHAEAALRIAAEPRHPATVLLSGGETTVSVRGTGRGGRNAEFALALAIALDGAPGIHALAGDTDGIDGTEDNAGAAIDPSTLARARQAGLDPAASLQTNDAYNFFRTLGDLVVTGPTLTNVNDFRAVLISKQPSA